MADKERKPTVELGLVVRLKSDIEHWVVESIGSWLPNKKYYEVSIIRYSGQGIQRETVPDHVLTREK